MSLFRTLTNRACEHGERTCYECRAYASWFERFRAKNSRAWVELQSGPARDQAQVRAEDGPWEMEDDK